MHNYTYVYASVKTEYTYGRTFMICLLQMGKKRLIVDLLDVDHAELVRKARDAGLTVSNFVRQSCGLPLEHQGKKRAEVAIRKQRKRKPAPKGD